MFLKDSSVNVKYFILSNASEAFEMSSLKNIENIEHIHVQLKEIYKELDQIHEGRKVLEREIYGF